MSQQEVKWTPKDKTRYLNKSVPRLDGPSKVTGAAKYTFDMVLPGMLYGKILRSPHASASVKSIDSSAAKALPGVITVIDDIGKNARFAGDEIAAVAAETEEIARDALKLIKIDWDKTGHNVSTQRGMKKPELVGRGREQARGTDPETLWSTAAAVVEGEYYVPIREHLSLETHGVVVRWDADDKVTCWCTTQAVHGVAGELSAAFGLPAQNVNVICEVMGGGFGSKFSLGVEGLTAAKLAKSANRPVKLLLERYEEQVASGYGPDAFMKCKAAMSSDGKLIAVKADLFGTSGGGTGWSVPFPYIYTVPNTKTSMSGVSTNTGGARSLRAPGHPQGSFLMETVVDELAYKLGLDPLLVRKQNQSSEIRSKQLDLGAERIGWNNRNKTPGLGTGRYRRGMGCATSTWGGGGGGGSQCDVRIGNDGSVWVGIGTQDLGTGTRTYVATIVAEELSLPLEKVTADIGKSSLPQSGGSGGSVTTASVAPTVKMAAVAARARLEETARTLLGSQEIVFDNGRVYSGDRSKSISFEELCAKLPTGGVRETGRWNRELAQGGVAGAQFVEVEVDTWTGNIQPIKVVAVQDCGYVMNRLTAESQLIGGVIQGLSMALLEDAKWDNNTGRMLNPNMETYKVLGTLEVPIIEPILFETHDKVAGIGEPAVIPTAAAFGNAVYNATGVRLRTLPMTPKRWFDALEAGR